MAEQVADAKQLRSWSSTDLSEKLGALRRELWQGRLKVAAGAGEPPHHLREVRHQIARILTVINEQRAKSEKERAR